MKQRKQITLNVEDWECISQWGRIHYDRHQIEMEDWELEQYTQTEMAFERLRKKLYK